MPKRMITIVFCLFIMLGMACNLSANPVVPQNNPVVPTSPLIEPSPSATEAPRPVTDLVLEILSDEGVASVNEWTPNVGCVPKFRTFINTPAPEDKTESHLKVAADGTMEGTCYEERGDGKFSATLTGKINWTTGTITFHLEAREELLDQGYTTVITMAMDGTGVVGNADQATGDSTWSAACRADSPDGLTCSPDTRGVVSLDVTGTVPWRMWLVRN